MDLPFHSSRSSELAAHWAWASTFPLEQTIQIMLCHDTLLATLLKQESGNGCLHQSVLIPLGVVCNETPHGLIKIFR